MTETSVTELLHHALQAEHHGRFDEARALLRRACAAGEPPLDAALRLARLCIQAGPAAHEEAEALLRDARSRAEQQGSPRLAITALHLLALLALHQQRVEDAARLLDESPALKQDAAPGPEVGQLFHYRGLVAAEHGDLANAERLFHRAYQLYREIHHVPGLGEVCDSLANLLLRRGKTRMALRFADHSLQHKRKAGDRYGEAVSLGTLGRIEQQLAHYDEARRHFEADLALARELDDARGVGIMLNSLGETALLQKDPAGAEKHFRDNLAAERSTINTFFAHGGLARTLLAQGRLDEAAAACDAMAAILAAHPDLHTLQDQWTGLQGAVAWRRGDLEGGMRQLREAIQILRSRQFPLDAIPLLYELRDLLQHCGAHSEAVGAMAEALDLWSECGSERGVRDVEDWLRTVDKPTLVRLALERHLPPQLVQDLLAGSLVAHAPRVQRLTVLFCDLRDYTTLSERIAPAELVELLNEWFSEATRAVRRHGGLVDKFIGDAVMALFGVPDERDDAAADAVRAALEMRDALAAMNLRQQVLGGPTLRIGIGIDTGEAVVGFIGSHLRQSYTAIGDLVNTASRLEGVTKQYHCDLLISQATQEGQAKFGVAETEFLGKVTVKGKQQEVAVYKVLGLRIAPGAEA